ncbi:MAG TPA: hypothetical protein VMN36_06805 [Verrucomicrobiales bacterium]|nr:hypothetical protein [Verrucomicrobiales bacterium]
MGISPTEHSAVAIWKRAIKPESGDLAPEEARAILRLDLSPADLDRADELAAQARAGTLTAEQERELDDYLAVGSALDFLKSKARVSLKRAGLTG